MLALKQIDIEDTVMPTPIRIDIFSDVICPWCYIGKRRLEIAAEMHGNVTLDIRWRTFLLNPSMQREGMDRQAYINAKFGTAGASFYDRISSVGKDVGIDFNFAGITRTPDSRPAHALLKSAEEKANDLKLDLFDAYFINGQDIGDDAVLAEIAAKYQLPYPSEQACHSAVEQDLMEAGRLNIQGVPFIIIEGEWAISGAHAPESFQPLFDTALAKIAAA
jgi:predicted DsbA family dithiol-disulfide isomerase